MEAPRDITDEFDDDALRASIEKADKDGQWRDPTQSFQDPKLEALRKQLSQPTRETYTARRMRELQKQSPTPAAAAKDVAQNQRQQEQAELESVFADAGRGAMTDGWRTPPAPRSQLAFDENGAPITVVVTAEPKPSTPTTTTKTAVVKPAAAATSSTKTTPARPQSNPLAEQVRLVMQGLLVYGPVALVQLMLGGWRYDILLRVPVASALAGVAWQKFDAHRMGGGLIGGGVHLLTFFLTSFAWSNRDIMANVFGLLAAVIGSGIVGMIREMGDGANGSRR